MYFVFELNIAEIKKECIIQTIYQELLLAFYNTDVCGFVLEKIVEDSQDYLFASFAYHRLSDCDNCWWNCTKKTGLFFFLFPLPAC